MLTYRLRFIIGLMCLVWLTGCEQKADDSEVGVGGNSLLIEGTPEYSAVEFVRCIYDDNNLETAIGLSTERLARILKKYHTNRNVQRHLLNLKYDSVIITPQSSNRVGRSEFAEKATITVFLSGMYEEDKIEDIRSFDLVNENGMWLVSRIHPDHFM